MNLPAYNESQVKPNVLPAPQMPLNNPAAQALEGFADTAGKIAQDAKVRADASVVMDSYVNFSKKALDLQSDALMKKGKDALNFDPYLAQFDALYNETKSNLSSDQQYIFDQKASNEKIHFETTLHRHANEQGQALNIENAKATVDIEDQKLTTGYLDEANYDIKNPQSQINHLRASVADFAHMQGISDQDPAFKDAIDNATSKAYVDRIKLLMTDRPTEANAFFKAHENEIEPQQRETLAKTVAHLNDEQLGTDAAFEYLDDVKSGKKTETDITKELHDKFKDNPSAFKVAQAEINHLYAQNRADQVNATAQYGGKIEAAIDKAEGNGQSISLSLLRKIPEYNELVKEAAGGNKSAEMEVNRLHSYTSKAEHQQKYERNQLAIESRRASREAQEDYMRDVADPETLIKMSDTQIWEEGRKHDLTNAQIERIKSEKKKAVKNAQELGTIHTQNINNSLMNTILDNAGIVDKEQRATFGKSYRAFIAIEEKKKGRLLTNDELKEQGIKGLQWQAGKKGSPFGIGGSKGEWKPTAHSEAYPADFLDRVLQVETKRKTKMTAAQVKMLYDEYQKEK